MRQKIPLLSKSRFISGLQCHKRLYFECYHRDLADEVSESQQAIFDTGTSVGELATNLYSGGILVTEDHLHHEEALGTTRKLLDDPSVPAVFEAAFLYDDIRVRADLLPRVDIGTFDLIEVKSTTSTKEEHAFDVAVQLFVLEGSGIKIRRACLCHINNEYVYQGGEYELEKLFAIDDITEEARKLQPVVLQELQDMRRPLWKLEAPQVKPGKQCTDPYICPFYGHCHADESEHHVSQLPRASQKLLQSLEETGIEDIRDIPADFVGLNATQQRVRDCVVNDHFYLDPELPKTLQQLRYPVHFLDFETFNPALPLYIGTRPYQLIVFQWSVHILEKNGDLRHRDYLHDGTDDPRKPFAQSLLETLGTKGSILVYSAFETSRIRELADYLPELSSELLALNDRIVDLLQLIRRFYYHPEFHGSFSIKAVLPALVPDLSYKDLAISDGSLASVAFAAMINPKAPAERREIIRNHLLEYCKRDTEAEVRLLKVFLEYV